MPTISVSGTLPSSHAGAINIELTDNHDATMTIQGSHHATTPLTEKLSLLAVGGNGMDGIIGADGYDGAPGMNGCDADMYTIGSNGAPGGNGGHGQAGSHGGAAGNGGNIDIWIKDDNLALLDTISTINVSAGVPGQAGKHGAGGRGGRGGRGGASFSWREPYTNDRTEHWLDAEGQRHSRVVSETCYHHHYSPGGSDGTSGLDGGTYTYPLYPGALGVKGQIHFHVMHEHAVSLHTEPYKLIIQNVRFQSSEGNTLWEPGDVVNAFYKIENVGKTMMSPPDIIPLVLPDNDQLELIQNGVVLGNIQAGATHFNHATPLQFRIKEPHNHTSSHPYQRSAVVRVSAQNNRLHQPFQHSATQNILTIQYPILLEPQSTHFSIAAHESHPLQATIKNIGAKALGSYAGRELLVEITCADNRYALISEHISLLEPQNQHQTIYSEQFPSDAQLGEQQTYHLNLWLQPINRCDPKKLIQQQTITGQLTPRYFPPQNNFLLVINSNTTKEQINYWTHFLTQLSGNNQIAMWNTSYYQGLTLDGSPCLLADTSQGTIIILDNVFPEHASNRPQHNSQYITQQQLLSATQHYDVALVALGNKTLVKPYAHSDRVSWSNPKQEHNTLKQLMTTLLHEDNNQPIVLHQTTIPLHQRWFFQGRESAQDALESVTTQLHQRFPNRTYHASIARTDTQQTTINIRRLADTLEQHMQQISLSDPQVAHPDAHNDIIQAGIIQALPFAQKLKLFVQQSNPYHQQLAQAITADLLAEQTIVMQTRACGSWLERFMRKNQRDFTVELKKLRQLVTLLEQLVQDGDVNNANSWSSFIIRMIAQVQYHAKQQSSFWTRFRHWFLPQTKEQIIASSQVLCDKILDLHSNYTNMLMPDINASMQRAEQMLLLVDQLTLFLKKHDTSTARSSFSFFSNTGISTRERQAVQQLVGVCTENAALDSLDDYRDIMQESHKIKHFVTTFTQLFPDFLSKHVIENQVFMPVEVG